MGRFKQYLETASKQIKIGMTYKNDSGNHFVIIDHSTGRYSGIQGFKVIHVETYNKLKDKPLHQQKQTWIRWFYPNELERSDNDLIEDKDFKIPEEIKKMIKRGTK